MKKKWLTSLEEPKPLYSSESNMAAQLSAWLYLKLPNALTDRCA